MTLAFQYELIQGWPSLAWLARCDRGGTTVLVRHGWRVETRTGWFGGIVWKGLFAEADFDRTDVVFGSGARIRDGAAIFVSPATTVSRLHSFVTPDGVWVSNSLPCLMAAVGASVDPIYPRYMFDFRSIANAGLADYKRTLATSVGDLRFTYFHNLRWDGERLTVQEKQVPARDFSSYSKYFRFMDGSVAGLAENLSSGKRAHAYRMFGTMSTGYDSPAACALARPYGLREALAFTEARGGVPDSGKEIGEYLGVDVIERSTHAWKQIPFAEVPFLAGDANGGEAYFAAAEDLLAGTALVSGVMGGWAWSPRGRYPGPNFKAGVMHGMSLCEFVLWAGCIHIPIAFLGGRQRDDLTALSNAPEMKPWDLGVRYSRPIPRRILEEAGVPRELFGMKKKFGAIRLSDPETFRRSAMAEDFQDWLRENAGAWLRKGRIPPHILSQMTGLVKWPAYLVSRALIAVRDDHPKRWKRTRWIYLAGHREFLCRYHFPWAIERAKERYRAAPSDRTDRGEDWKEQATDTAAETSTA